MARKRKRGRRKSHRKVVSHRSLWLRMLLLLCLLLAGYVVYLDLQVRHQFDGKRWSLPARVYARPLDLYVGRELTADQFQTELRALYYLPVDKATQPGRFSKTAMYSMSLPGHSLSGTVSRTVQVSGSVFPVTRSVP